MSGVYHLKRHDGIVDRTTWWKNDDRREAAGVWRIYGKGLGDEGRIATDAEVDLWQQVTAAAPSESQSQPTPKLPILRK